MIQSPWVLRISIVRVLLACLAISAPAFAQEASTEPPPATGPQDKITADQVDKEIARISGSDEIEDAAKTKLLEVLQQAKAQLAQATEARTKATGFQELTQSAQTDRRDETKQTDAPPEAYDFDEAGGRSLSQLRGDLSELESQLKAAREVRGQAQGDEDRRGKIAQELTDAKRLRDETQAKLAALEAEPSPTETQKAQRTLLAAEFQAREARVAALEAEKALIAERADLPTLRLDNAARQMTQLESDIAKLTQMITQRQVLDAQDQQQRATDARDAATDALKPYWETNIELADRRLARAAEIQSAAESRVQAAEELTQWSEDFTRMQKRAEEGTSDTLGLLLVEKRSALPGTASLKRDVETRGKTIRQVQSEYYLLQDRRTELADEADAAAAETARLRQAGEQLPPDAEQKLQRALATEKQILDNLIEDTNQYATLLLETNQDEEDLIELLDQYSAFVDKRVFWIRTAAPLRTDDVQRSWRAFQWLTEPSSWREAGRQFTLNLGQHWVWSILACAVLGGLVYTRRRVVKAIKELGEVAAPRSCRDYAPTGRTLLLTIILALPLPILAFFGGWMLRGSSDEVVRAVSLALTRFTLGAAIMMGTLQICRNHGLADSHFAWPPDIVRRARSSARVMLFVGSPFILGFLIFRSQEHQLYYTSLGRACFVALMLLMSLVIGRALRRRGDSPDVPPEEFGGNWIRRTRKVWYPAVVLLPLVFALLAIAGFYFTAWKLAGDLLRSVTLFLALLVVEAILFRWVRVKRRQLRWQQALEHREQRDSEVSEATPATSAEAVEHIAVEEDEVDYVEIDQKTRRLIRSFVLFAGLLGLWAIWTSVLPMLSKLEEQTIWGSLTAFDLLFSLLVVGVTVIAAKNIPGLVNMLLLERLRLESSIRYAFGALSQYAIVVTGIVIAAGSLGISWDKVQWLVAALSVGLGFGLQEVVANFVCGIVLLFERPIRVGDVVTLNNTTGVVTKIAIRSTTVRNWDRQELIIPNKDLITGQIINWTLSNRVNRFTFAVGVAYGSDTRRTTDLLKEILVEHPKVLDDPPPIICFDQFGDSTLNFTLRIYLAGIEDRLETIHDLHTLIHERFNKEGIEIAFPQRDLHIRSIEEPLRVRQTNDTSDEDPDVDV